MSGGAPLTENPRTGGGFSLVKVGPRTLRAAAPSTSPAWGGPALRPRLDAAGSPDPAVTALGRRVPSGQPRRRPGLTVVLRRRLPTAAPAAVSANPSLHPDERFELSQFAFAQPPRRGVSGRRQRDQRALRVAKQAGRGTALVIEQAGRRRGGTSWGRGVMHAPCSDRPPLAAWAGGHPHPPALPAREGRESPSGVRGDGPNPSRHPLTLSVGRCPAASRPSPHGSPAASLGSATHRSVRTGMVTAPESHKLSENPPTSPSLI